MPPFYGYVEGNPVNSTDAQFHTPIGLALDSTGEYLFVADCGNNAVRVVDLPSSSNPLQLHLHVRSYSRLHPFGHDHQPGRRGPGRRR